MSSREWHLGNLISTANERARTLDAQNQGQAADIGLNSGEGPLLDAIANISHSLMADPGKRADLDASLATYVRKMESAADPRTSLGQAMIGDAKSAVAEAKELINATDLSKAEGVVGKAAAVMGLATAVEQTLSAPFSRIPFPAMLAVRVWDLSIGLPHGHAHPPTMGTPLPSIGPILKIGLFGLGISGATKTKINGEFAARCGDLGIGVWCGGYFPIYTILLGSSSVWIEGMRAARAVVDLTLHCIGTRLRAINDAPLGIPLGFPVGIVGLTGTVNTNVLIGGFPLPSLTSIILGLALRPIFAGLGKVAGAVRNKIAAKAAREAAEKAEKEAAERAAREAAEAAAPKGLPKPLKPKSLEPEYKNENILEEVVQGRTWIPIGKDGPKGGPVKYLSDTERAAEKLIVKRDVDGVVKLFKADGTPFDTSKAVNARGGPRAIYVMDTNGNLYASNYQKVWEYHHSTLGQGKDVAGAGNIEVQNGVVKYIDRGSGHYKPHPEHLQQTVDELRLKGLDIPDNIIRDGF
jgi:uncharacterized Zn-binding protein involved in type VI secretion